MDIKEVLNRLGYVRNSANLSARKLSEIIEKSPQYVAQIESGRIVLTVERLLQILEACNFPLDRFFSDDIINHNINKELFSLIENLPTAKKINMIEFLKK